MRARRSLASFALAVTGLALTAACSSSLLAPATSENVVDTVTMYAWSGTPLYTASAYALVPPSGPVRTDLSGAFDFVFNIDSLGRPVFIPANAAGFIAGTGVVPAGLQLTTTPFAALTLARTDGYEIDKPLVVDTGTVVLARSRSFICPDGEQLSLYAKVHVLAVDMTARTVTFEILLDQNCAYLGLTPGLPSK